MFDHASPIYSVHVRIILDETGSMAPQRDETIVTLNAYIASLKADGEMVSRTRVSLTQFNTEKGAHVERGGVMLAEFAPLTAAEYAPAGGTPLYDAVGATIAVGGDPAIVVIVTDGHENASREFTANTVSQLVRQRQAEGWTFVFLGAGLDRWETDRLASTLDIADGASMAFSKRRMRDAGHRLGEKTAMLRRFAARRERFSGNVFSEDERRDLLDPDSPHDR